MAELRGGSTVNGLPVVGRNAREDYIPKIDGNVIVDSNLKDTGTLVESFAETSIHSVLNVHTGAGNTHFGHADSDNYISHNTTGSTMIRTYDGANYADVAIIDGSGNLGVNTTSPLSKLHVNGDVRVNGNWYWSESKNFYLDGNGNGGEWSFDMSNFGTGTPTWQVWSDIKSGILKVYGNTGLVVANYNMQVHGHLTVYGDQINLEGASPTLHFTDTDQTAGTSGTEYWIHQNSGHLYFLQDRDDADGTNDWESPHPLVINSDGIVYTNNGIDSQVYFVGDQGSKIHKHSTSTDVVRITTPTGYIALGSGNSTYAHFYTDRSRFYMEKQLHVDGEIYAGGAYDQIVWRDGRNNLRNATQLNNLTESGWYDIDGATYTSGNAPTNGWYYVHHIAHSVNASMWAVQIAYDLHSGRIYYRRSWDDAGVRAWTAWQDYGKNEGWQTPTFANGWLNYGNGYNPAGYYRDLSGRVHLRGLIKAGTVGTYAFTLPSTHQPPYREMRSVIHAGGHGRVDVIADGRVIIDSGVSNTWVSLDGISFMTS